MKMDDSALGRILTRQLNAAGRGLPCPSLEEIAAVADGSVDGAERDTVMGHLAECGECRRLFVATRELATGEASAGKWRRFAIPSALAAAAVLVIAVTLDLGQLPSQTVRVATKAEPSAPPVTVPQRDPRPPVAAADTVAAGKETPTAKADAVSAEEEEPSPAADRLAATLARSGDPRLLAAGSRSLDKTYGFAGRGGGTRLVFHIGVDSIDLEVALLADDDDRAQAHAVRLGSLLQALTGDDDQAEVARLVERLDQGDKPSALAGRTAKILQLIPPDQVPYVRLGAWAQGARLAAKTGNGAYFAGGVPKYLLKSRAGLPPEAATALRELERKVKDPRGIRFGLVEKDLEELFRAF